MKPVIKNLSKNEKGITLVEYALGASLIAIAAVAMIGNVGQGVNRAFTSVNGKLPAAPRAPATTPATTPAAPAA